MLPPAEGFFSGEKVREIGNQRPATFRPLVISEERDGADQFFPETVFSILAASFMSSI